MSRATHPVPANRPKRETRSWPPRPCSSRAGFQLLELLMVVAIVAVVFVMYFSYMGKSGKVTERKNCAKNLQRLMIALDIYATDHQGRFPDVAGAATPAAALDVLLPRYTVDATGFICPGSRDGALRSGASIAKEKISYAYYMGYRKGAEIVPLLTDQQVDARSKNAGQTAFSTTAKGLGSNHEDTGGNVLFSDGHVDWSPPRLAFSLVLPPGVVLLNP